MKLRRWIPMLLTLLLVFNLLPTTVLAEGVSTRDYSEYGLASFIEPTNGNYNWMDLNGSSPALTANSEGSTPVMTWADLQAAFNAGGSITLQQGISASEEDSALTVPSGVEVALDLNGHTIDRRLTSAVASGNVITVNGTLTITDTSNVQTGTITGANNTGSGGAIINKGRLTVSGGTISGNRAQEAGAVLNAAGSVLTISGGTFENNTASTFGGGAIVNHGTVSMSGGLIQNNTAVKNGGGIWSDGTLTVTNGSFANNTAQADGGAVYITGDGSVSEISGGTITGNTADQSAGAVYMIGGTTTISGGTITGNTAKAHGGALYVAGNSTVLNLFGGTITGNTAANQGGAIVKYQDANTINIQGSPVILNNQAAAGPDIYMRANSGLLNVTGALSADARIGVTLASGAGTVTFNYGTYNGPDRLACFVSSSPAYAIGADSSQEIVLGSPVTVSFDPGPGTGTMQSVQVANNSYYQLPDCGFTPPHHQEFESWTVNGSSYFPGMYVTISGDTAVKAEYVKHSSYTRVAPVAPTDTVNGSIEYYTCDVCGGYYLYDGSTYTEVTASAIVLPYFTIAANGSEATIQRYNGSDAEIVIPDTVPDNYPDETLRGRDITAVDQSAFENNTVITKVVMGDNIRLIRWHAFYNTSNLKEIVIGSGLYTLESDVFNCPALTSFTCTATQPAEGYYPGLEIPNARVFGDCDISNITFYGMHSGAFHYSVWTVGFALDGGKRNYIGLDAHSDPTWTWAADLSSAEAVFACNDCDYAGTQPATVTSEVTTQPTWTTPGVRTYTASVIVTGVTYTDTRTEEIPVLTYTVTVNGGTADKASAAAGESVTITANAPGTGKRFKEWTGADGLAFTSGSAATATATFTMPANAVTLTATYEDIYSITVNGGTTDKASAAEGESVTITANEPEYGKRFKEWTGADGLTFTGGSSAASSTATFTMPGRAVTLAATYETSPTTIVTVEFGEGHGDFAAARFGSVEGFTVTGTTLTYSVVLDSTIGDAKEVFSSKADFYPPAVDDGELFTDDLALNPAGYYASLAEVNAERAAWDGQPVPVEGLKFYAQWEKPVGAVTVSVTAPDPGTEVTVSGNEPMRRTDPQVSVSVTGNVTLDTASGANWWTDYDGTYYSGTVASGQACYARFYLNASYGYYLMYYGAQGPVVADGVSVTVENDSEANISIQSSYIRICAKVIAGQHAVSVANGTADKAFAIEGESVTITANAPEAGMRFKEWTGADGLTFTSGGPTDAEATFTMPAADVTVSADFITQWTWLQQQLEEDGNTIVLDRDIVCVDQDEGPLTVPEDIHVTLDLNGHTVDRNLTEPTENGNVITVIGELTLCDSSTEQTGVITGGNNLKDGGGVLVRGEEAFGDEGSFIMEGGTITGNTARDGGGVSVGCWDTDTWDFFYGYFEMYGGVITGNLAATEEQYYGYGGGVYVSEGQFCLFGGEISENHSDLYGGGVYVVFGMSSAPFVVSGAPVVRDNTCGDVPETDNVAIEHWADSCVIYVEDDGLAPEASIGVNVYTIANYDTNEKILCLEPFTSGLSDNGGSASNFVSDFAGYTVILNEDGEAMLAEAAVAEPEFKTHALALEGKIGVTFFMDLSGLNDDEKAASYMTFAITGAGEVSSDPVLFDPAQMNATNTYYGFSCYVNAIQMADTIAATYHYGDGLTVSETYSIAQYINSFDSISSQFDETTVALVHALADYGHYVQPFLSASHSWTLGPGDDQYAPMDAVYTTEYDVDAIKTAVADYAFVRENNSADIQKITYSVRLDSDTAILVYFKPTANYDGSFTVTLDGETYTATKQSDGRYLVEIPNIGAHLLGTTYTIVATTDNGTATVTVSALSYVRSILNSSTYANDATAKNAACAIYAYCAAAKAYKDAQ